MLSPQQIEEYTEIFLKYKKQLEEPLLKEKKFIQPVLTLIVLQTSRNPISRGVLGGCNPPTPNFILNQVFTCESCDSLNGHALGYYDLKEYVRFYYRKKSIYQRKYHYENKVKDISKRLALTDDEQYCLYNKLMEIEEKTL